MTNPVPPIQLRDHWWWRPGWVPGRSFYTWHVTFAEQPDIHDLVERYTPMLANLPMFDSVPIRWLHLTMQGLGFTDEVDRADVDAIARAAQRQLAACAPFTVTIGPPQLDPEGLPMPVLPAEPLHQVRKAIRAAIADVWGEAHMPDAAEGWWPHVTLAYSNVAGSIEPAARALATHPAQTAEVEITTVSLIGLNRDNKMYEWGDVVVVRLGEC